MHCVRGQRGFTMAELLIALLITGLITVAAFHFYMSAHQQVLTQQDISEIQQINRACLEELSTSLRLAGYGLDGHDAYTIIGDSLYVYYHGVNPVDTVLYYLDEFSTGEYAGRMVGHVDGDHVFKMMKKENSATALIFADYITKVMYTPINPRLIAITVEVQSPKADESYEPNNGFRRFINTERVVLRNVA